MCTPATGPFGFDPASEPPINRSVRNCANFADDHCCVDPADARLLLGPTSLFAPRGTRHGIALDALLRPPLPPRCFLSVDQQPATRSAISSRDAAFVQLDRHAAAITIHCRAVSSLKPLSGGPLGPPRGRIRAFCAGTYLASQWSSQWQQCNMHQSTPITFTN